MARTIARIGEVPLLHLLMVLVPAGIALLCLVLLPFYPKDEQVFLQTTITGCLTFIFGKFTNGFGKPMGLEPQGEQESAPDPEEGSEDEKDEKKKDS